ncbi:MAG: type II toxin-antitoxin system RatA family toxin [Pseudomonadota bacterium]
MPCHEVTRQLPYTAGQMFDLVSDVPSYPQFLPWCAGARVRSERPEGASTVIDADLIIAFKVFREKFGSRVTLIPDEKRIETDYIDGPFKYLKNRWSFIQTEQGCDVTCFVDFEFKSLVLQSLIGVVFNEAMSRLVHAFEARAHTLYGATALPKS